jgi:hypothetical protein
MATFPLINGNYFNWQDIEFTTATQTNQPLQMVGIKSINYKDNMSKQLVPGTSAVAIGVTKGKYRASGDLEMFLPQANLLITTMGPGWHQQSVNISVSYISSGPLGTPAAGLPQAVITDTFAAFLVEMDASQSEGDDALTRKFTLLIPGLIFWNGIPPVIEPSLLVAIA